jgi:uncharacterized protein YecA (UPF0149 family)
MKIGRNEPCPCASAIKYKKWCLYKTDDELLAEETMYSTVKDLENILI